MFQPPHGYFTPESAQGFLSPLVKPVAYLSLSYGAKYYSYFWSEVLAMDMFSRFQREGVMNYDLGKLYVERILAPGGSINPGQTIQNFLGRQPNQEAFLAHYGLLWGDAVALRSKKNGEVTVGKATFPFSSCW